MDDFELDEGTMFGAEDAEFVSGRLDNRAGSQELPDGHGGLNDSEDESSTIVDLEDIARGGSFGTPSHDLSGFASIPGQDSAPLHNCIIQGYPCPVVVEHFLFFRLARVSLTLN